MSCFGFDPIHCYIADEGLARFCTKKYKKPTKANYREIYMHLTNYCINKLSPDYQNPTDEEILLDNQGNKRTMASLWDTLSKDPRQIDIEELKAKIAYACGKVMEVYGPMMEH